MIKKILLFSLGIFLATSANSQNTQNNWYLTVGTHATNFGRVDEITNGDYWDFQGFPTDLSFGRSINEALSVNFVGSLGELDGTTRIPRIRRRIVLGDKLASQIEIGKRKHFGRRVSD